jgi:hypothetical protein
MRPTRASRPDIRVRYFSPTFSIPELLRTKIPELFPALNRNFDSPDLIPISDCVGTLRYKLEF